jgi:hypothetical protein
MHAMVTPAGSLGLSAAACIVSSETGTTRSTFSSTTIFSSPSRYARASVSGGVTTKDFATWLETRHRCQGCGSAISTRWPDCAKARTSSSALGSLPRVNSTVLLMARSLRLLKGSRQPKKAGYFFAKASSASRGCSPVSRARSLPST